MKEQLYKFLARRTDSKFNKVVLKRLNQSRTTKYPISLSRLVKIANNADKQKKTLVVVGNVLNDERLLSVPKLTICCLKCSDRARDRVVKAGGEIITFDQLAKRAPKGAGTVLLRGPRSREALKHFGLKKGQKGGHAKPYVRNKSKENKTF